MNPYDLKVNVGQIDLHLTVQRFALYLGKYLMYKHHTYGLLVSMTRVDAKLNVCHSDLYFHDALILPFVLKRNFNTSLSNYESI